MVKGAPHYATLFAIKSSFATGTSSYGLPHHAGSRLPDWTSRLREMTKPNLNWIANPIWGVAEDVLRDVYVRGKNRDVILPLTLLR